VTPLRLFHSLLPLSLAALLTACGDEPIDPSLGKQGNTAATKSTAKTNAAVGKALDLDDRRDFEDATRGLLASRDGLKISTPDGEFAVVIQPARGPLTKRKRVIADNPHNRLVEYLVEGEHSILYESRLDGASEFHLLVQRTVRGTRYDCQDRKGRRFSLPQAHTMLLACRSLMASAKVVP